MITPRPQRRRFTLLSILGLAVVAAANVSAAPWVAGYYAGWEQSHLPFSSVDLTAMDAVIDFAVVPSAVGTLDNGTANEINVNMASRVAAVHAAGKKILFTVGGAGAYAGFQGSMSSTYQATFVANIAAFMIANGYDGVDIDMEPMAAVDVAPYVAFAKALRAKLTAVKPGSLLTAAVTWEPSAFAQLTGVFDHIDLMTYSMTGGTWYNETWHDSPVYSAPAIGGGSLASVDSMVKQFTGAGVPAAGMGIGITFDPYIWTGGSGVTKPQQTWTSAPTVSETYYYTIAQKYGLVEGTTASAAGSTYGWDASAQAAYLGVTGSPASNDAFISYDDVSAINAKIAYAAANGIGSVIIWDLAGGWRTDLPVGSQGKLLAAIKAAAYGTGTTTPAPVISAVAASGVGVSSATITWTTNVGAEGQVEYGLTSAYGVTSALNTALSTSHTVTLTGLSAGTSYHYAAVAVGSSGGLATSADYTFTTPPAPSTTPIRTAPLAETFTTYPLNTCIADGAAFGPWTSSFGGYGCNKIAASGAQDWLEETPAVSTAAALTHSSLVLGPAFAAPVTFSVNLLTNAQLRQNSAPNPWEVGWVVWDYTDNNHFYSFMPQPNGWELNKEDPAYPGSQRFLASGTSPVFPIGAWYAVKIVQTANVISVYVNGALITTYTDTQTPYTSGRIGFYNEDSDVRFMNAAVDVPPATVSAVAASIGASSATVTWTTNEIADTAVEFGPTAAYTSTSTVNTLLTTAHSAALSGLAGGTLYHYAVLSRDIAGDRTASADYTFTTVSTVSAPVVSTAPVMAGPFINNFSSSTLNTCFVDGTTFGSWTSAFGGYGCTQTQTDGTRYWLALAPAVSTAPALTHAALTLGPAFAAPTTFSVNMITTAQLRKNSPPNPWEVGWVIWDYADNQHFYYFQPKPNGWELGKEDPAYPGSQRFLATGTSPTFPIGGWYVVRIVQTQNILTVYVNGRLVTTYTDASSPYTTGKIGFYVEDADVRFADVAVDAPAAAGPAIAVQVAATSAQAAVSASAATLSGMATIVAATANSSAVVLVQFLLDGAPLGAALTAPPFSITWDTTLFASGSHALSATAWDTSGNSATAAPLAVMINNVATAASTPIAQAKAPQKFLSPALADGINDVATFGTTAAEVSIYNVRGRLVFHSTQQGAPIIWNCKDGMGRVDESGVYIAKIRTTNAGVVYQSFAIVK